MAQVFFFRYRRKAWLTFNGDNITQIKISKEVCDVLALSVTFDMDFVVRRLNLSIAVYSSDIPFVFFS